MRLHAIADRRKKRWGTLQSQRLLLSRAEALVLHLALDGIELADAFRHFRGEARCLGRLAASKNFLLACAMHPTSPICPRQAHSLAVVVLPGRSFI